ncbi:MAG: metal ABC transporter substrate-binding protein [Nocardioides sp.]|uniref:metal ABC transporter substrate-binding protein n=1 Tax=Nocardioides sp. TaxID=35761 RepID=UPI0039E59CC4
MSPSPAAPSPIAGPPIAGPRVVALAAALAIGLGTLTGCAAFSHDEAADDGALTVVAGLYPLQWIAQQVVGDQAEVEDLTNPGAEPHDLELTPKQTADVADADLVVYLGGLQAAVDTAVDQVATGDPLDVATAADLQPLSHDGHDDLDHTDSESEVSDSLSGQSEESTDPSDLDPHFWQDPMRMASVADAIAAELGTIDPGHSATYERNAKAVRVRLQALNRQYRAGLADCARDTIVVSHNAFGYLAKYGLYVEPIAGLSPDAEPTPADLARLQELIESKGITAVFGERLAPAQLAETLASDMHVTTAVLDPIEGLTSATSTDTYLSLMRDNLSALKKANGCR